MLITRNYSRLGQKQLAVIADIFDNALSEPDALAKNHVSKWLYKKWLANPAFLAELDARFDQSIRQTRFLIARCLPLAVQRLTNLIVSDKDETARKACLDLISLHAADSKQQISQNPQDHNEKHVSTMPPELAEKILAAMVQVESQDSSADIKNT